MNEEALQRLEDESERTGQSRSEVARTLIEEGLRMAKHPGIVFRDGAMGRRPALSNGPDVWVYARVFKGQKGTIDDRVRMTAELMGQPEDNVRIAADYYREFRQEIDGWMSSLDREAERAEDAWLREQERIGA